MHDEIKPDAAPVHPEIRYEKRDVRFGDIALLVAGGAIAGLILHVVIWYHFKSELRRLDVERASRFPLAAVPSDAPPRAPRLEQIDRLGGESEPGRARLNQQERELYRYRESSEKGFVRIPIERAMDQLAGKLPVRKTAPDAGHRANGLVGAGEPNSGRLFRKEAAWFAR
jgi:hypothetical protein